jgi:hypothetical protein
VRGTCTNLSLGGLFLEGVQLAIGTQTVVGVEHPVLGRFTAPAEVRHHSASPRGMGVQFMRLEPQQLAVLQKLVALVG